MTELAASATVPVRAVVPVPRWRAVAALVRADHGVRRSFAGTMVLDVGFGVVNLLVFYFISRTIAHPGDGDGSTYFGFAAVGIAFMLVVQTAATATSRRVRDGRIDGTLEWLVSQPITTSIIALGLASYPFLFAAIRACGYLGVAALLGLEVGGADWFGVVVILTLASASLIGLGVALAALAVVLAKGDTVARVLVVALAFCSGVYFPVSALHPVLQAAAWPLPTRVALDGLRQALAGQAWSGAALTLVALAVAVLPLSLAAFAASIRLASRRGTLAHG